MLEKLKFKAFRAYAYLHSEKGQGMVEYGLVLALIAVVAIAALTSVGGNLTSKLNRAAQAIGQ